MILALETSSATASAAVVDAGGAPLGESQPVAGAQQARRLLECVHEALAAAGAALDDVTTVVCGLGPGTFTGLRIGVATARALAQAADLPIAGVPSLEALARGLAAGEAGARARLRRSPDRRASQRGLRRRLPAAGAGRRPGSR